MKPTGHRAWKGSDSEIRLGDWQTFQKFGAAGARCVPTMVGRAAKKILRSRQPFLIGKWPLLGAIPLVGAQRSSQAGPAAFPSTYTFRMEAQTQRRAQTKCKSICTTKLVDSAKTAEPKMAFNFAHLLSAACGGAPHRLRRLRRPWRRAVRAPLCGFRGGLGSRKSRFVPDFDVSGKTAEPKMAFNFAHLLSAACGGAPRRLGRLRRPPGSGSSGVYGCGCARYTTGALWRAPGEHDYAVVASTRERVASIFTKTLGVPSAASIRSDVTVPGAPGGTA